MIQVIKHSLRGVKWGLGNKSTDMT